MASVSKNVIKEGIFFTSILDSKSRIIKVWGPHEELDKWMKENNNYIQLEKEKAVSYLERNLSSRKVELGLAYITKSVFSNEGSGFILDFNNIFDIKSYSLFNSTNRHAYTFLENLIKFIDEDEILMNFNDALKEKLTSEIESGRNPVALFHINARENPSVSLMDITGCEAVATLHLDDYMRFMARLFKAIDRTHIDIGNSDDVRFSSMRDFVDNFSDSYVVALNSKEYWPIEYIRASLHDEWSSAILDHDNTKAKGYESYLLMGSWIDVIARKNIAPPIVGSSVNHLRSLQDEFLSLNNKLLSKMDSENPLLKEALPGSFLKLMDAFFHRYDEAKHQEELHSLVNKSHHFLLDAWKNCGLYSDIASHLEKAIAEKKISSIPAIEKDDLMEFKPQEKSNKKARRNKIRI